MILPKKNPLLLKMNKIKDEDKMDFLNLNGEKSSGIFFSFLITYWDKIIFVIPFLSYEIVYEIIQFHLSWCLKNHLGPINNTCWSTFGQKIEERAGIFFPFIKFKYSRGFLVKILSKKLALEFNFTYKSYSIPLGMTEFDCSTASNYLGIFPRMISKVICYYFCIFVDR
jgi:hypothetical protein